MFDVLDELEAVIDKVAAFEGSVDVERLCVQVERLEFQRLQAIGAYDRSCVWQAEGFLSTASALRSKCRMGHGTARRLVDLARKLELLAETAVAFGAGEISREHAEVITTAYTPERAEMIAGIEPQLVELARFGVPRELLKSVKRMSDAFDGDGGAASDAAEHAKNRLTFDSTFNGRYEPHGSLDTESGEIIVAALDAEMETLREAQDSRPRPLQRAEALTSICRWYLAQHDNGQRRRGQTHLSVIADLAELAGTNTDLLACARAETAHGGLLSRSTLERLACDCKLTRVITDGPSQILDVGRATREISPALWNALVARDKHCTEPGCSLSPAFCEAHHIVYWTNGGPTNLDNPSTEKSHPLPQAHGRRTEREGDGYQDRDTDEGAGGGGDLLPDLVGPDRRGTGRRTPRTPLPGAGGPAGLAGRRRLHRF